MKKTCSVATAVVVSITAAFFTVRALQAMAADGECRANLSSIGLAIRNYEQTHNRFPSPNAGGHSWRVRIVPYLFASALYQEYHFDEPWDSPSNLTLYSRPLPTKDGAPRPHGMPYPYTDASDTTTEHTTRFLMFVGEHAFGQPNGYRRASEITDDPETVLVAAETRCLDVHWLKPFDFSTEDLRSVRKMLGDRRAPAPAVLFADGSVYRMSIDIPQDLLRGMITIDGDEVIDRKELIQSGYLR